MKTVLEFVNVGMHYPYEQFALMDSVSFKLESGEKLGMVLARQWGKSTVAKLIAGLKMPTAGQILLNGAPLEQTPPEKRNIAVIYDDFALMKRKFWVNAAYPLKVRKVSKRERRQKAEDALEKFGLKEFSGRRVSLKKTPPEQKLSLALARASLRQFDLIVFDDVFRNVNTEYAQEKIKILLSGRRAAQLFLSSDVTNLSFCDRLIVVADGKNCFEGNFSEAEKYISESRCFDVLNEF